MPLLFSPFTTRSLARSQPTWLFVFGDNLGQWGLGGQAAELRGEPNAVGIPTKYKPTMQEEAFFSSKDYQLVLISTKPKFQQLTEALLDNRFVIWPLDGIGTGLAQLPQRAPTIAQYYQQRLEGLKQVSKDTAQRKR